MAEISKASPPPTEGESANGQIGSYIGVLQLLDTMDIGGILLDGKGMVLALNEAMQRHCRAIPDLKPGVAFQERFSEAIAQGVVLSMSSLKEATPSFGTGATGVEGAQATAPSKNALQEVRFEDGHAVLVSRTNVGDDMTLSACMDASSLIAAHRSHAAAMQRLADAQRLAATAVLAGGIAHDLGNLLSVIRGNVSFLEGDLAELPDLPVKARRSLNHILESCSRGGKMVSSLLSLSHPQGEDSEPKQLPLSKAVVEFTELMEPAMPNGVHFSWATAPEPLSVVLDPVYLQQILSNFCINAARAVERRQGNSTNPQGANPQGTNLQGANPQGANLQGANPQGTAKKTGEVFVMTERLTLPTHGSLAERLPSFVSKRQGRANGVHSTNWARRVTGTLVSGPVARLAVWDNGTGMTQSQLISLFRPIHAPSASAQGAAKGESDKNEFFFHKSTFGGAGLGLAMCAYLVAESGGALLLESAEGEGTVASVFWELAEAETEAETETETEMEDGAETG